MRIVYLALGIQIYPHRSQVIPLVTNREREKKVIPLAKEREREVIPLVAEREERLSPVYLKLNSSGVSSFPTLASIHHQRHSLLADFVSHPIALWC